MDMSKLKPLAFGLGKELIISLGLLFGVSIIAFSILLLAPGDPFADMLGGPSALGETRDITLQAMGIPSTWYGQYALWLSHMLTGDFGVSMRTGAAVSEELISSGINTLYLTLGSLLVTLAWAIPVSIHAVLRSRKSSFLLNILTYIVSALPSFWISYIVIYYFIHQFNLFPVMSGTTESEELTFIYYVLPVLILGIANGTISEMVRHLREEFGRVMKEDYIKTARAKGASVWKHSFKEGILLPITEIIAAKIPYILGGAIIVEQVFNWPGLGRLAWQAALDRDFPVIMGIVIVAALFVRFGSLIHHIVFITVNPRTMDV